MSPIRTQRPANRVTNDHDRHTARDASGFNIFSAGDLGAAHAMAHRLTDSDQMALGQRLLGQWLATHEGSGSDWVHLHFHMAIFEIAVGDWTAAYERYRTYVLPAAITSGDALTDAPALLWRLAIAAPMEFRCNWQPLRRTALSHIHRQTDPYVEVHNLLALAGARDIENIDRWLEWHRSYPASRPWRLAWHIGTALRAYAARQYRQASVTLSQLASQVSEVGGSRAQNQLFDLIAQSCAKQAHDADLAPSYPIAA